MSGAEVLALFGALSSILQIIDFTGKVVSHAHETVVSKKDATQSNVENKRLGLEYQRIGTTLKSRNLSASGPELASGQDAIQELGQQCHDKAQALLEQLARLTISPDKTGIKRLADGSKKAVQATVQKKDIERQRRDLQELNSQLATAMLQTLLSRQHDYSDLAQKIIEPLRKSTEDAVASALALVKKEHSIKHHVDDILTRLSFTGIHDRWQSIERAYESTYTWALERDESGLKTWLQSGSGIFWITGKPGAGKSTMMKFLVAHKKTRELLKEWSGSQRLVIATHYFWYLGSSALQKSTSGLLRTILYNVISECPSLAVAAFPELCEKGRQVDLKNLERQPDFSHDELVQAFGKFASQATTQNIAQSDSKFCLFIDGLDEFNDPRGNHGELVALLRGFARNSNIKLCVSSRPDNAFRNAFEGKVPSLRMEDLTKPDIRHFVHCYITSASVSYGHASQTSEAAIASIVNDVTERAEGVFLWVFLVVSLVARGLAEGEDIDCLRYRVEAFPQDLDDFFNNMLDRTEAIYKRQTHQALKFAWLSVREDRTEASSFADYWLIGRSPKGIMEPSFAFSMPVGTACQTDSRINALRQTRTFLSASTKELLVLDTAKGQVSFLHRTVYDFLTQEVLQIKLDKDLPAMFHSREILDLMSIARFKLGILHGEDSKRRGLLEDIAEHAIKNPEVLPVGIRNTFVTQFEQMLLLCDLDQLLDRKNAQNIIIASNLYDPRVLGALVAFHRHEYVTRWMTGVLARTRLSWYAVNLLPRLKSIVEAMLGASDLRKFPIQEIDLDLMKRVLGFARATGHNTGLGTIFGYDCECKSASELLLQRWAATGHDMPAEALPIVWNAFKLLWLDSPKHETRATKDFLLQKVPEDWFRSFIEKEAHGYRWFWSD